MTRQALFGQITFKIFYSELFTFKVVVRMLEALLLLFLIILLMFIFVNVSHLNTDGFVDTDKLHSDYVTRQSKQWGNIGISLLSSKREGTLGNSADKMLHTIGDKKKRRYPLNTGTVGLFDITSRCEAVKTMDCNAFDDTKFSKSCGICLDIGENSEGSKAVGGLVVLEDDKKSAREGTQSNFIPEYKASIGFCPAGKLVTTKEECLKLQRQLLCNKNSSFDLPGCSQCYTDTTYSIVDEKTSPGVITDSGEISIIGVGTLNIEEHGFSPKTNVRLSASTPYTYAVRGKETTRVKFTLTPPSNSDPDNPTIPYMAASLSGETGTGTFSSDVRRIVFTDEVTGRKPRSRGMATIEGTTVTKMAPGFGQTRAIIIVVAPFSFTETTTSESTLCNDGPFVTTQAAAEFLESDPCYKKGSGPGKFSLECLQGAWDTNGCNSSGKGYPKDNASAAKLMTAPNGSYYSLNDLSDYIYNQAIITSTGIDENGVKQEIKDWSKASVFCTGREITSPCDVEGRVAGPLSVGCLQHLWNNQGAKNKRDGSTYTSIFGMSIYDMNKMDLRGCSTAGTLSPMDANGNKNQTAIQFWKSKGGVEDVKKLMADIHSKANADKASDEVRSEAFNWCYGTTQFAPRPATVFKCSTNLLPLSFTPTKGLVLAQSITMTQDYQLDFDITPKAIGPSDYGNIFQFSSDDSPGNTAGSRAPGIWIEPGGTNLLVTIADNNDKYWSFSGASGLTLNKMSHVSLFCNGSTVRLTIADKVYRLSQPSYRYSGPSKVYGGCPWNGTANAEITNVCLKLNGNSTTVENTKLGGDWIGAPITVQKKISIDGGNIVHAIQHGEHTKMVVTNSDKIPFTARYYPGSINDLQRRAGSISSVNALADATGHYVLSGYTYNTISNI